MTSRQIIEVFREASPRRVRVQDMNHRMIAVEHTRRVLELAVCALALLAMLGCGIFTSSPSPTSAPAPTMVSANIPTPTPAPTHTPVPTATPYPTSTPYPTPTVPPTFEPTVTPQPTYTPAPVATPPPAPTYTPTPADVYALVAPSVPFIETAVSSGSGVLIQGGYVITNYHVVWPFEVVWVVFPDGAEMQVPVVGWDPITDLAVLGPVDVAAKPLTLQDGEDLPPGSELFLVGYPAEVEQFPKPTITRGVLSRLREWERAGMTYLQTDASIADGQSGGALVNSRGEVAGISGFVFSEAQFGLAASTADIAPIVEKLIQGQHVSGLGDRRIPAGPGAFEFDVEMGNFWDTRTFVLDGATGTMLQIGLVGAANGVFQVSGPSGILEVDHSYVGSGTEQGAAELPVEGVYFLQVEMESGDPSPFALSSNIRLQPFHDPDDGQTVTVGQTIFASLDHAADYDWYSIRLNEGETIRVATDSLLVDTAILVDFPGALSSQVVFDDDTGGGLFGTNSELVYRAPNTGEYFIIVGSAGDSWLGGGYYLSVATARAGTETVYVPAASQVVESRYGEMMQFDGQEDSYRVEVPGAWEKGEIDPSVGEVLYAIEPNESGFVLIVEGDIAAVGLGDLSLEEYADLTETDVLVPGGAEILSRGNVRTPTGLSCMELTYLLEDVDKSLAGTRLICFVEDVLVVNVTYVFLLDEVEEYLDLVEYSFRSFQVR